MRICNSIIKRIKNRQTSSEVPMYRPQKLEENLTWSTVLVTVSGNGKLAQGH